MITKQRQFLSLILSLALFASAVAQQPTQPSVDRLRKDVTYLASEALDGRRTGTQGANDAAHYIAGEFSLLGLKPGMQIARPPRTRGETRSRYLQPFPYVSKVELGQNNLLYVNPGRADDMVQFKVGEDWIPLGFSSNTSLKAAEATFVGYGISSADLKYNDYLVSNAKDRICIAFDGTPDGDNPHGQFGQAGQPRFKAAAARGLCLALMIITKEDKLSADRLARLTYDNAGEAGVPMVLISKQLAARLLPLGPLSEYEAFADLRKITESPNPGSQRTETGMPRPLLLRTHVPSLKVDLSVEVTRSESPSYNVIGILPGSDPKLKDEAVVIGAHYDHLGRGGQGSLASREGEVHYGADDNASGTAGLLELARVFSTQRPKPRRTIVFIAFSGEEEGLIGSNYYVNHPVVPLANTVAMINLDMIGRERENKLTIGGVGTATEWRYRIQNLNTTRGLSSVQSPVSFDRNAVAKLISSPAPFNLTLNEDGYGPSDHSSFYAKQIPVLFFWTGTHADYHKPSDTAEKINYVGLARITSFVANIVRDIDKSDPRPTYSVAQAQSPGRSMGFRIYLGTIPNYADSTDGMLLDSVRDNSPAAKAGLKAGDKIVKMAGRDVKNVYDYTYSLGEMKSGQEYEVEIVRAGQRLTLKITPEKRQ